jgi:hypothetical protein
MSYGADGVQSDDDLSAERRTKRQSVLETSAALLNLADAARRFRSGAPLNERLKAPNRFKRRGFTVRRGPEAWLFPVPGRPKHN